MERLVSAVITTHNRRDFLEKALHSVLAQTYPNLEVIVVDDQSTDGTREYMEAFVQSAAESRRFPVTYIYNAEGGGGNHARNTGILAANGDYIAFLDDDDEWLPEKTQKQADYLDQHPEVGAVGCARILEYDLKDRVYEDASKFVEGDRLRAVFKTRSLTTSCLMVRRELLLKVGMFDENLRYWQEYELLIRLCQEADLGKVKENLALFRIIRKDKNRLTNNLDKWEESVQYLEEKHADFLASLPPEMLLAHRKFHARDGATRCENIGDKKRQREYLKQLLILEPTFKNTIKFILNRRKLRPQ